MNPVPDPVKPSEDGRSRRWDSHRERRRGELVEAVIAAVRELGPGAGIDAVAAHAGVSKPVLYRYFTDKSGLWDAVAGRAAAELVETIAPAVASVRRERELVHAAVDAYLSFIEADPHLYRFVVHQGGVTRSRDVVADAVDVVAGILANLLGDRLRDLGLDDAAAQPWAYGIVGYVQTVGDWWQRHGQPMDRKALGEHVTAFLWGGVAAIRTPDDPPEAHTP